MTSTAILSLESQIKTDPFNPVHHIALAKAYLENGDEERARKIIAIKRKLPSEDPSVHLEWGRLCEEFGMARQARESYELAIVLSPNNSECHFRVALLYFEKGAWERALRHLQKAVSLSPNHAEAKKMLASLYEEVGFQGSAVAVHGKETKGGTAFHTFSFDLSEEDVNTILNLFKGREFGYAIYHLSPTGIATPSFVKGTLGFNEIRSHLRGEETYGVYPLRGDRTLKFACIHIAIPWRKVLENVKTEGFLTLLEQKLHAHAQEIIERSREYGILAYLENSGERDRRIWFFFEEFVPLELAERLLGASLDKVPAPPSDATLSLYMGVKGKGIGHEDHPVMLPLGYNRRTGKQCFFIDEHGDPHEDQLLWVKKFRTISRAEIQNFTMSTRRRGYEWVHVDLDPLKHLEKNCPVIAEIIRKARSGRMLRREEKMVIFFTLGFFGDNLKSLHRVLEPCPDYRPKKVDRMASRLKSNPISCPKIRELLPETTAYLPCNCSFTIHEGGYPSPLLHIEPGLIRPRSEKLSSNRPEELLKELNDLNHRIDELTKRRDELRLVLQHTER
jgi:tetratricopeptide (TPR) repeat protein